MFSPYTAFRMGRRRYITTAIDFPNAAPHMGHVYEKILADVLVRWYRLQGDHVLFHLGTDENGIKIQQTAKQLGLTPRELIDRNAPAFEALFRRLDISFDFFIRTANAKQHWPTVTALWNKLQQNGYLEKRSYTGLYCNGCERFLTFKDLVDGLCPDHRTVPENITEENWFFLLSRMQDAVSSLLHPVTGSYRIVPAFRARETLNFLEGGLEDVSFSRSRKTLTWGVPVPDDSEQVMYVWCDNLTSYISSLGLLTDHAKTAWWDDAEVTHVIGKDIARFHAINWPAMLMAANLRTPDRLLIHGFITSDGQKMSKSIGNVIDPVTVLDAFPVDALRFFLLSEVPVGNDGDFTWKRFTEIYDAKLRNQLGNLLNRVLTLLQKDGGTIAVPESLSDASILSDAWGTYRAHMDAFAFSHALAVPFSIVDTLNARMNGEMPWKLMGDAKRSLLSAYAEYLRHVSLMLLPFLPATARTMAEQLGLPDVLLLIQRDFVLPEGAGTWGSATAWYSTAVPSILFPPVESSREFC